MVGKTDENSIRLNEDNPSSFLVEKNEHFISKSNIRNIIIFFAVGVGTTLFFQKFFSNETVTFSSLDLITFTFSIALSGASIILAIIAIELQYFTNF